MIDRPKFYNCIRKNIFGRLTQEQVDSINAILDECLVLDNRQTAYVLGTAYHETAHTMLAIEEYCKGKGKRYGKKIKMSGEPYEFPDKIYYGRGFVQLTWYENYEMMGKVLNIPLLEQPELALDTKMAAKILVKGMKYGLFTGKSLDDYFNSSKEDWINARRIVNGLDKAELIAQYAQKFYYCLENATI